MTVIEFVDFVEFRSRFPLKSTNSTKSMTVICYNRPMRKGLLAALLFSGCVPRPQVAVVPPQPVLPPPVEFVAPADWPVLADDLPAESLALAAERSALYLKGLGDKTFRLADRSVSARLLMETASELARVRREAKTPEEMNALLKERFDLYRVSGATLPP